VLLVTHSALDLVVGTLAPVSYATTASAYAR
jgi:hypothetical protein